MNLKIDNVKKYKLPRDTDRYFITFRIKGHAYQMEVQNGGIARGRCFNTWFPKRIHHKWYPRFVGDYKEIDRTCPLCGYDGDGCIALEEQIDELYNIIKNEPECLYFQIKKRVPPEGDKV